MVVCKFFQQGNCRYGHSCRFEHVYGSKFSYRAPQTQTSYSEQSFSNNNFSSRQGLDNPASSLFRSAVQNISTFDNASGHTFVQQQSNKPSVFDRLGPKQTNTFSSQNSEARSIFAQANQNVFGQTQPTNVFQTQNQTAAKSLFAQATQSIFGQHPTSNSVFNSNNNFATNQHTLPTVNMTRNVFPVSNTQPSNVFGERNNVFEQSYDNDDVYSRMEELSQSDIEVFESVDFKLGFIPELPPPKILCV